MSHSLSVEILLSPQGEMLSQVLKVAQVIWICLLLLVAVYVVMRLFGWFKDSGSSWFHGTARWASKKELRPLAVNVDQPIEQGAFILAPFSKREVVVLPREVTSGHILILGPTGAGKSRGFYLPNCRQSSQSSFVCTDPKSEAWHYTSGYHKTVIRYAPRDPDKSACFNWIPLCTDSYMAEQTARALIESGQSSRTEQFWIDVETAYLSALFAHTATLDEPTPATAYDFLVLQPQQQVIKQLLKSPSRIAREQANIFMQTSARLKGSIVPAIAGKLRFLRDESVRRFTSAEHEAPDFSRLQRIPMAVYWCLHEGDISRLQGLTAIFYTVLLEQLAGGSEPSENGRRVPVTLMMDEFGNIGKIPHFETIITIARGRGVAIVIGLQSVAQLDAVYGRDKARVVLQNLNTKISLSGLDHESAEYISRALGDTTVVVERSSTSSRGSLEKPSTSQYQTEHQRRLLTADEVRRIDTKAQIIICKNWPPMLLPRFHYDLPPCEASASALGPGRTLAFALVEPEEIGPPELPPLPDLS